MSFLNFLCNLGRVADARMSQPADPKPVTQDESVEEIAEIRRLALINTKHDHHKHIDEDLKVWHEPMGWGMTGMEFDSIADSIEKLEPGACMLGWNLPLTLDITWARHRPVCSCGWWGAPHWEKGQSIDEWRTHTANWAAFAQSTRASFASGVEMAESSARAERRYITRS